MDRRARWTTWAGRGGFSLIEVLVVILIIGVLASLILVAVGAAGSGARRNAMRASASTVAQAARQFEQQFGFPPPLVQDGLQSSSAGAMTVLAAVLDRAGTIDASGGPVAVAPSNNRIRLAAVYNPAYLPNRRFLEGLDPASGNAPSDAELIGRYDDTNPAWRRGNQRYSKYSLAYYLAGALPSAVDGVDGPGMVRPLADGTFQGVTADSGDPLETAGRSISRERFEAFVPGDRASARLVREYFDLDEYRENSGNAGLSINNPGTQTDWRHAAITDSGGKAFRYYRWEPLSSAYGIEVGATYQLNIPSVLLDEAKIKELLDAGSPAAAARVDLTNGDASLRSARWAVVGAGPDGLFGTEPIGLLRERLRPRSDLQDWEVRALAKSDNVVEVGR
jgi:prepilin-type N-terminal cleavage/methylation domain-containing protein